MRRKARSAWRPWILVLPLALGGCALAHERETRDASPDGTTVDGTTSDGSRPDAGRAELEWARQLGTAQDDRASGCAVGEDGAVYVVGYGGATLADPLGAVDDVASFLRVYDVTGRERWSRRISTSRTAAAAVAVDPSGDVYVAGETGEVRLGEILDDSGRRDAFLRRYDARGNVVWTQQFGAEESTPGNSGAGIAAIALDGDGHVYVAGATVGTFPGETRIGQGQNAFVRRFEGDGTVRWTRQLAAPLSLTTSVTVDERGAVRVGGVVTGDLEGTATFGGQDAMVWTLDPETGALRGMVRFGSDAEDGLQAIAADARGAVVVAGYTVGTLPGQTRAARADAFVAAISEGPEPAWILQFGTPLRDRANGVAIRPSDGTIYVAGLTQHALLGETPLGGDGDAFLVAVDPSGELLSTRLFGTTDGDSVVGMGVGAGGAYLAGDTIGAFPGETALGGFDAYVMRVSLPGS